MNTEQDDKLFTRRSFLKMAGSGIIIFISETSFGLSALPQRGRAYPTDFNAYLKIGEDGRVSVFCSKIEMGQGIITSMAQMLGEELDVSLESIDMVMGDTMLCPWDSGTTGSRSTKYFGPALRKAGAEARAILLQLASEKLEIEPGRLLAKNSMISDKLNPEIRLTYGELVKGKQITRHIYDVPTKAVSEHTVSGKATKRTDAWLKVTGEAKFTGDLVLPGMLHAKILRPPSHDARLKSIDTSGAENFTGATVIREEDLIAVLHPQPELAERALEMVRAEWDVNEPGVDNRTIFKYLKDAAPDGRIHVEKGSLTDGQAASVQSVESEF